MFIGGAYSHKTCDNCGKTFYRREKLWDIGLGQGIATKEFTLCPECLKSFVKFLSPYVEEEECI